MNERLSSKQTDETYVTLPSDLRMRQRLGQLSIGESIYPQIAFVERATIPARGLVLALDEALRELAHQRHMGIEQLTLKHLPRIIELIVDNEEERAEALRVWQEIVNAQRDDAEKIEYSIKQKVPRKQKKRRQSGPSQQDLSRLQAERKRR